MKLFVFSLLLKLAIATGSQMIFYDHNFKLTELWQTFLHPHPPLKKTLKIRITYFQAFTSVKCAPFFIIYLLDFTWFIHLGFISPNTNIVCILSSINIIPGLHKGESDSRLKFSVQTSGKASLLPLRPPDASKSLPVLLWPLQTQGACARLRGRNWPAHRSTWMNWAKGAAVDEDGDQLMRTALSGCGGPSPEETDVGLGAEVMCLKILQCYIVWGAFFVSARITWIIRHKLRGRGEEKRHVGHYLREETLYLDQEVKLQFSSNSINSE